MKIVDVFVHSNVFHSPYYFGDVKHIQNAKAWLKSVFPNLFLLEVVQRNSEFEVLFTLVVLKFVSIRWPTENNLNIIAAQYSFCVYFLDPIKPRLN